MVRIRWTNEASEDLRKIHQFLFEFSPSNARKQIELILAAVNRVSIFPFLGKSRSHQWSTRYVITGNYCVMYLLSDTVEILFVTSVIDSRMNPASRRQLPH